jgi:molybdopterin converting factor small subunit
MQLQVHLHTIIQRQTPDGLVSRLDVVMPQGSTLMDLIEHLDIELAPEHMLLAVNRRMAEPGQMLHDGDMVNLMPAISGGCLSSYG